MSPESGTDCPILPLPQEGQERTAQGGAVWFALLSVADPHPQSPGVWLWFAISG